LIVVASTVHAGPLEPGRQKRIEEDTMRMRRMGILVVTSLVVSVPAWARQGDTAGVAKTRAAYEKASNAHDAAAISKLFTADGTEMPPNAPAAKGRAAIEAMHKTLTTQVEFSQLKIAPTDTKVVGDFAYEVGTYTQTITPKGGKPAPDKGKYVVLLKKVEDGSWEVVYSIYNSDMPAAPMK
jgi:uncharacterized protein (TIGR02246 family)